MYNFYSKEEVEWRLAKLYGCRTEFITKENGDTLVFPHTLCKTMKETPSDIASKMLDRKAYAIPDYEGLLVFDSQDSMEEYRRTHR